jgi:aminoglycoside/choline kinase family phosphotransferase
MSAALRPVLATTLADLYPGAKAETLPGDASTRRFHRLFLSDGGTCVVMDYGAPFEGETEDVRLSRIFNDAGLPVGRLLRVLPEAGALVVEDLGDETMERALTQTDAVRRPTRDELYRRAVRLAAQIATRGTEALARSERATGPALDEGRFLFEMNFFLEHYVGSFLRRPDSAGVTRDALDGLARRAASHPRVLCHRDFHTRNIMVRPTGELALVDIQDARWGPDTYDLASLLWDAYSDLEAVERTELAGRYWGELPGQPDIAAMTERLDDVAAQRMIKALGTFGYQVGVLGRERYRSAISRTCQRLRNHLPGRSQTAELGEILLSVGILDA